MAEKKNSTMNSANKTVLKADQPLRHNKSANIMETGPVSNTANE